MPLLATVAVTGAVAGLVAGQRLLADEDLRTRLDRQQRVWRLTARRAAHFAVLRIRGARADEEARARLEERFAIRSAEDVARELGNMKGAIMKAGQMIGFIAEGLPPEAQAALASLQADVEPMAPSLAEQVVRDELGADVETLFLDWEPVPVAAASIGQVHRAVMHDGRVVAVKVQYPGVDKAIKGDLDNAEQLYGLFASFALKGMDVKGVVDELRARMADELDYRHEAECQAEFAARYRDHPFIHVPHVVPALSSRRVLTSEWVDGQTFAEFEASASPELKRHAAEVQFRFAQGSVNLYRVFNGDPHPGNYRFHPDGSVTFLDFGLVKRWQHGEMEALFPILDAILDHDAVATAQLSVEAGFLAPDHRLDPERLWEYVSAPYRAYLTETFTFDRRYVADALETLMDLTGPYKHVIQALNMPPSFVILDRVVWGISALMGKLGASGPFRGILQEYRHDGPPVTELGRIEATWRAAHPPVRPASVMPQAR
jgi:predicted unusual protein kinase regulating ubiquinone biosynthesis (AarF/ABC1/UbiB family)